MGAIAQTGWNVGGLVAGFGLSFLAFGLLWIGVPWKYQLLMFFPFLVLAFVIRRFGTSSYTMLLGMLPIAAILVQFRDKDDSHVMPIALVCAWAVAILLGNYLAVRAKAEKVTG